MVRNAYIDKWLKLVFDDPMFRFNLLMANLKWNGCIFSMSINKFKNYIYAYKSSKARIKILLFLVICES